MSREEYKQLLKSKIEREHHNIDDIYKGRARSNSMNSVSVYSEELNPNTHTTDIYYNLIKNTIPIIINLLSVYLVQTLNIAFVGTLNSATALTILSLSDFYLIMTGMIGNLAFPGAINKLCNKAFKKKEYYLVSVYTTIALIINILYFCIIFVPLTYFSSNFFSFIRKNNIESLKESRIDEERTINEIQCYIYYSIPNIFIHSIYSVLSRYLQSMRFFNINMITTFVVLVLHPLWLSIFMFNYELEIYSIVIANTITNFINLALLIYFIIHSSIIPSETKPSFSKNNKEVFNYNNIRDYFCLGFKNFVFFLLEALSFELLIFISAFLSTKEIAANSILFNFSTLMFMLADGIGSASCSYIGNSVAKGNTEVIRKYVNASFIFSVVIGVTISFLCVLFNNRIGFYYTSSEEVVEQLSILFSCYSVYVVFDFVGVVVAGICEGLGRHKKITYMCFFIMYIIGVPALFINTFYFDLRLNGMWVTHFFIGSLLCFGNCYVLFSKSLDDTVKEYRSFCLSEKKSGKNRERLNYRNNINSNINKKECEVILEEDNNDKDIEKNSNNDNLNSGAYDDYLGYNEIYNYSQKE